MTDFKYLICLDVEATCWDSDTHTKMRDSRRNKMEVIEFAAVLLNTSSRSIESEFHKFIRPVKHTVLSNLCTRLTGITQAQIERERTFPEVYPEFREWLDKNICEYDLNFGPYSPNVAFCSWTSYDINDFLYRDFIFHHISMPNEMKRWIDLKQLIAKNKRINRRGFKLGDALRMFGSNMSGIEHSGLDDARNLARLANAMIREEFPIREFTDYI